MRSLRVVLVALGLICSPATSSPIQTLSEISPYELLTLTDVAGYAVSPDGAQIAVITRRAALDLNSYRCELLLLDTTGKRPVRSLGAIPPRVRVRSGALAQAPQWSSDGSTIFYLANAEGIDQLWAQEASGGPPKRLTSLPRDVLAFAVQTGGNRAIVTTYALGGSDEQRSRLERRARVEGMLWKPPLMWGDYLDDRGLNRYVNSMTGIAITHYLVELDTAALITVSESDLHSSPDITLPSRSDYHDYRYKFREMGLLFVRSPDSAVRPGTQAPLGHRNASVVVRTIEGRRHYSLQVQNIADEEPKEWYHSVEAPISTLSWSIDGKRLYFTRQRTDGSKDAFEIYWTATADTGPTKVYSTAARIENLAFDRTGSRIYFLRSTATQPSSIAVVDVVTGREHVIFDPNPWLKQKRLPHALRLSWVNELGARGFGMLLLPALPTNTRSRPPLVIVSYRAAGFLRGGTGDEYPIYPLVAEGFAVLALDVGETHATAGGRESIDSRTLRQRSQVSTVEAAMYQVCKLEQVDCSRVALTGLSFGATMTWQALIHTQLVRTAIVSDGGLSQFPIYLRGLYSHPSGVTPLSYLPVPAIGTDAQEAWRRVSTTDNAHRIRAPILVHDADQEFDLSLDTFTTMQGLGKPFELVIYPDAGHIINQPAQRYSIYNRNIDWLRFWLMDYEDSSPHKAEQYARWRLLKQQHEWNEQLWRRNRDPAVLYAQQREAQIFGESIAEDALAPMLRANASRSANE